jgi:D-beta-D-heptose 7-phosphate kinase/D-beta-D-heptose 1-phosphate adenosyltransferase
VNENLLGFIDLFPALRVGVIGDGMLDSYLTGKSTRLCREAPVPVVALGERVEMAGGAANSAVNLHTLGAQVTFLSVVGNDAEGRTLKRRLEEQGIGTEHMLADESRLTLAKNRVMADSHLLVRFDSGDTKPITAAAEVLLAERLHQLFPTCDAFLVSDYGYGVLTPAIIASLGRLQRERPIILVADSRNIGAYREVGLTAVKPNYDEAAAVLRIGDPGEMQDRSDFMETQGNRLLAVSGARIAAITLDSDGAVILERGSPPYRTYARPTPRPQATGAGDTFVSALTLALAAGASAPLAAELASAAAAIVVGKERTAACYAEELREYFRPGAKIMKDQTSVAGRCAMLRSQGMRLVFTNGCFDILHKGHIAYLNQAKALGDVLLVGVNSDESVARLKGHGRPINTLEDRTQVLSALSCVDLIVPFSDDTPERLIEIVRPDVFVKGGDYTRDALPEAATVERLGGLVRILPYIEDKSTTRIIERICNLQPAGE